MVLPKVLIINQPFNTNTGGGITLSNLFAKWDRDKLAVSCSGYLLTEDMDTKLCNNYYQLGSKERKWIFPFNILSRNYYSGSIQFGTKTKVNNKIVTQKSKFRVNFIEKYMLPIFDYLGIKHFMAKFELSEQFKSWLDELNPDILYTQAARREDILLCVQIRDYLNKPLVFHMMDDWPATLGKNGFMKNYWERKINKEFQQLLDKTDVALSISDYMGEEYKKRYGKNFITFHNPICLEFWKNAQRTDYKLSANPEFLYAGRVGLGIDVSLRNIAEAIKKVNKEMGAHIKFVLQTREPPVWIKNYRCVEYQNFVAYEELPRVFADADFLVLPYDFSDKSMNFIKYSMPTKATEYMVSGTPILIFAPEDTALVKYAQKLNWAMVETENNVGLLAKKIKKMVENESLRKKIAQNAINIAEKNHGIVAVSNKFAQVLSSAVS